MRGSNGYALLGRSHSHETQKTLNAGAAQLQCQVCLRIFFPSKSADRSEGYRHPENHPMHKPEHIRSRWSLGFKAIGSTSRISLFSILLRHAASELWYGRQQEEVFMCHSTPKIMTAVVAVVGARSSRKRSGRRRRRRSRNRGELTHLPACCSCANCWVRYDPRGGTH